MGYRERYNNQGPCPEDQRHVHELQGSVKIAGEVEHQHRFCTVTGEAIPYGNDHVHEVTFRTDTYDDHHHEFRGRTGCAVMVGDRHVHYIESVTSVDDGHRHTFEAATMIENPTGRDRKYRDHHDKDDNYHK
ncbi:MAG: hypothetical protein K0S76_1916 [Herbinix sp.]|nr:hypothetical protein [Herbinix sp.]